MNEQLSALFDYARLNLLVAAIVFRPLYLWLARGKRLAVA